MLMPGSETPTLPHPDTMDLIFNFPLFIVALISFALLPGPDTLLAAGKTLTAGRRAGFITNVLNPKVGLFFISFLPQFVQHGPALKTALALALLGLTFVIIGMAWICAVVMTADTMVARLRRSATTSLWMQRGVGALFVGIAARMALAEK